MINYDYAIDSRGTAYPERLFKISLNGLNLKLTTPAISASRAKTEFWDRLTEPQRRNVRSIQAFEIDTQGRRITSPLSDGEPYSLGLQRDFVSLLQFDQAVDAYTPDPLTLRYRAIHGEMLKHAPSGLVVWQKDRLAHDPRPLLVEIQYRQTFRETWMRWKYVLRALKDFAHERDWQFGVITEREIRTPLLANVTFLLPYRNHTSTPETEQRVLEFLEQQIESTPGTLVSLMHPDKRGQVALLPVVWKLMAERRICFHFDEPLTMESPICAITPGKRCANPSLTWMPHRLQGEWHTA